METTAIQESAQYLSFRLGEETFAFEVLQVREVLELPRITRVPRSAPYMLGVLNLRGGVLPVVDLRAKLGLDLAEPTIDSAVIILEVPMDGGTLLLGALVDAVKAVIRLEKTEVEPPPGFGMKVSREFISGIGKKKDQFIILLHAGRVFSRAELDEVADKARTEPEVKD